MASLSAERFPMAAQVARSGIHVCAAANSGVSRGGWLVSATQSGSILPMRSRSPLETA